MSAEDRVFVDSNILVYAYDLAAGRKHHIARDIVAHLWQTRAGVVSNQVLQEFYVNITRKLSKPLPRPIARQIIATYAVWPVYSPAVDDVVHASDVEERYQVSFWDALILVAARRSRVERVLSEDMQSGHRLNGVLVENPFQ
jgi:predicted nucleic acid-binding protein